MEGYGGEYLLTSEPVMAGGDARGVPGGYRLGGKAEEAIQIIEEELGLETVGLLGVRLISRGVSVGYWVMLSLVG